MLDEEELRIRHELSEIPLGELQGLRRQIGTKKFDTTFRKPLLGQRGKEDIKRLNKHRPREISSNKPVSRFKQVVIVPKKEKGRDPRFDQRCGHLNVDLFSKSFFFLDEIKKQEKAELEKQLKKAKEKNTKKKLEVLLQKMKSRDSNRRKEDEKRELIKQHRKFERKLVKGGKQPFYLTKVLERKVLLAKRYKELKESGQLDRVIRKRRKRNAAKDKKRIPARTNIVSE